jgi:hypothetical protein
VRCGRKRECCGAMVACLEVEWRRSRQGGGSSQLQTGLASCVEALAGEDRNRPMSLMPETVTLEIRERPLTTAAVCSERRAQRVFAGYAGGEFARCAPGSG